MKVEHYSEATSLPKTAAIVLPLAIHPASVMPALTKPSPASGGELRAALLSSTTLRSIIAARGARSSSTVLGVSGMAGVGKTCSLIALGHDKAVRAHFHDGVLYIPLGADASMKRVISSIVEVMQFTRATASAAAVKNHTDLTEAIKDASLWFKGRRNLFLVDDVWPTEKCPQGFLSDLRGMLKGSPDSRIVLTTQSRSIGSISGVHVDYRDPHGPISMSIFMEHATPGCQGDVGEHEHSLAAVQNLLGLCAGLPIALAVTGCIVAAEVSLGFDFEYACDRCWNNRQQETNLGASVLDGAIQLSLKYLETELKKSPNMVVPVNSLGSSVMRELYSSLCVLEKQQCMPISLLA